MVQQSLNRAMLDANLELEEMEGMVKSSTNVGTGNRRKQQQSYWDMMMEKLCSNPQQQKKWMTYAFIALLFLLIVAANAFNDDESGGNKKIPDNVAWVDQSTQSIFSPGSAPGDVTNIPVNDDAAGPKPPPEEDPTIKIKDMTTNHNNPVAMADNADEETIVIQEPDNTDNQNQIYVQTKQESPTPAPSAYPSALPKDQQNQNNASNDNDNDKDNDNDNDKDKDNTESSQKQNDETKDASTQTQDDPKKEEPLPKRNAKIPALEPDIMVGPVPDDKWAKLAAQHGYWHFWDGDADRRPDPSFLDPYTHNDIPGDKFPEGAWQTDAVYVNHYLDGADRLIDRAMEAIFSEYGHGKPLPPEEMKNRMKMFHWEKLELKPDEGPPPMFSRRGQREIGGWTTKRSVDGLVKRLLHAMMTKGTFTVVLGGHSAAQGMGNHFRQSYTMQFHRIMKPIFERLGVKLITRNISQGGLGTLQAGMGAADIFGREIDIFLWDSGMTEGGALDQVDLVLRQVLIGGNRVPLLWGGPFDILKMLHNEADVDVGEFGTGYAGIPETTDEEQMKTLPWATRGVKCAPDANKDLCNENRYNSTCWIDRPDGIKPHTGQYARPKGQVKWHPGWRPHQLMGRVLAFAVLEGLETAVNTWMESTMTGQPLDDDYWHITEYYENIRNKVKNLDKKIGFCYQNEGKLPTRMCNTPMKGRTQYSPRQDYYASGLTTLIKPANNGWVPKNEKTALYEGPDVHLPAFDVPEGEVDVLSIVMGRRRRRRLTEEGVVEEKKEEKAQEMAANVDEKSSSLRAVVGRELSGDGKITDEPGEGWEIWGEPQGLCDGTYDAVCGRSTDEPCILLGHHDARGAIVGNEWAGWLIMNIPAVKEGIIVVKVHSWHTKDENPRAKNWKSVNAKRRLGELENNSDGEEHASVVYRTNDRSWPDLEEADLDPSDQRRHLVRNYDTPELPETFAFDYAINGEITSLNSTEFDEKRQKLQRVVETITLMDDPEFSSGAGDDGKDVEVAFRLRGVGNNIVFGISHIYWA